MCGLKFLRYGRALAMDFPFVCGEGLERGEDSEAVTAGEDGRGANVLSVFGGQPNIWSKLERRKCKDPKVLGSGGSTAA